MSETKKQQVIALGQLGWTLRKIEQRTGVRRETASGYLKQAGVAIRPPGRWGRAAPAPSSRAPTPDSKPANELQVTTDFGGGLEAVAASAPPGRSPTASACEAHREAIELGVSRGRNAVAIYQDLVDSRGFTGSYSSVKRFVRQLRAAPTLEARAVIETAPGEEAQVDYGSGKGAEKVSAWTGRIHFGRRILTKPGNNPPRPG